MIKQTALEWLIIRLTALSGELLSGQKSQLEHMTLTKEIFEQARFMEQKQMGYSKEDVMKACELVGIDKKEYDQLISLLDEAREINRKNV